jgi:hypothetical protein
MECFLWKNYVLYSEKYNYKKQKIISQHFLICFIRRIHQIVKSDYWFHYVCLCPSTWNNSAPTGQILIKFDIRVFFKDLSRKEKKFHYYMKRITSMIRKDLWTFMTISHTILLRIIEVSGRSCRENQHTFCYITFSKTVLWDNVEQYGTAR